MADRPEPAAEPLSEAHRIAIQLLAVVLATPGVYLSFKYALHPHAGVWPRLPPLDGIPPILRVPLYLTGVACFTLGLMEDNDETLRRRASALVVICWFPLNLYFLGLLLAGPWAPH